MEVDYQRIFNYMLHAGLCDEADRAAAKELCEDWLNIYNETSRQEERYYASGESYARLAACGC